MSYFTGLAETVELNGASRAIGILARCWGEPSE